MRIALNTGVFLSFVSFFAVSASSGQKVELDEQTSHLRLTSGRETCLFTKIEGRWALEGIEVDGQPTVRSISRTDSFYVGGGEAAEYAVLNLGPDEKAVRFRLGTNTVTYTVNQRERLPAFTFASMDR